MPGNANKAPFPILTRQVDQLRVETFDTRRELGLVSAADIYSELMKQLDIRKRVRMIFAAAPSQADMLLSLVQFPGVDWSRVPFRGYFNNLPGKYPAPARKLYTLPQYGV